MLGVQHVDSASNFFSLGGSSLTAIRMAAKIQDVFGVSIPIGSSRYAHARFIDTAHREARAGASAYRPMLPRAWLTRRRRHEPFR